MLLAVDIGNTNISAGVFDGDELVFTTRIDTKRSKMCDQYAIDFMNIFGLYGKNPCDVDGVVISSVVSELTGTIEKALGKLTGIKPLKLTAGVKTGLNILTDNPSEVGADLVAAAVAAKNLYPAPCIIIDLGTASKLIALDENGAFIGCAIAPGLAISIDALAARTSQLPRIGLYAPKHVIGKNTVDSMSSGMMYGTAAMIDGMCERMEKELKSPLKSIVATGGFAGSVVANCKHDIPVDDTLVLKGLKIIYEKNR